MNEVNNKALCFDDILLVPQQSTVVSRHDIDISMNMYNLPVVSSPMDTVTEWNMAAEIAKAGGIGIIHRYMNTAERINQVLMAITEAGDNRVACYGIGVAISAKEALDSQFIQDIISTGAMWVCVDTANGHNESCIAAVKTLKSNYPKLKVMAGNVSTSMGYTILAKAGADAVRVGIGGGATCTTRIVSGHGVPTLQSIIDCSYSKDLNKLSTLIVADGGIKTTGDIVKSFAAGADLVMLGSMLAGTEESPGEVIDGFKNFRGMASAQAQVDWRGEVSVEEGVSTKIPFKGSVTNIINQIKSGIGSGCSYSGVNKLSELADAALYNVVSPLSMGESKPHALN
jgi:IMP dehydrogenase